MIDTMTKWSAPVGRLLLALIFIMSGINKIFGFAGTQGYMEAFGVPGMLLPLVILVEIGCGVAIVLGWQTRISALLLAGFTLLAGIIFHRDFGNQVEMIMFLKNLSITGGLLILFTFGPGNYSLDNR